MQWLNKRKLICCIDGINRLESDFGNDGTNLISLKITWNVQRPKEKQANKQTNGPIDMMYRFTDADAILDQLMAAGHASSFESIRF